MRAQRPVPVAERSSRPGATTTAFLVTAPTPCHGSAICTMLTPAIAGFSGCAQGSCSRAATRISSPTCERSRGLGRLEREAERVRVGDRVPHAAEGNVDGEGSDDSTSSVASSRSTKQGTFVELDALAAAVAAARVDLDEAGRRLEAKRRLGLVHLDHAGLEQDGRDADRVRARHRGYSVGSMMM